MTSEQKKLLFWDYIMTTPVEKIKPLEELTIDYLLRKRIGLEI